MKTAKIGLTPEGKVAVDFGGEWDGTCCGPEEKALVEELKRLGVQMDFESVSCRLPAPEARAAAQNGDCVVIRTDTDKKEGASR